jgi:hypothetical protein
MKLRVAYRHGFISLQKLTFISSVVLSMFIRIIIQQG